MLSRLRLTTFYDFVRSQAPPPARLLEIGCGDGELALALAEAGYDVTAIDPKAPAGGIFKQTTLEDFTADVHFDVVVASVSLHHVEDLQAALTKVAALLRPRGVLILEEFAKERLAGKTARWYHAERRARHPDLAELDEWLRHWTEAHADVHPFEELHRVLNAHFDERYFERGPYLYDHWLDDEVEPLERELIEQGAIEATGVRFVGERR